MSRNAQTWIYFSVHICLNGSVTTYHDHSKLNETTLAAQLSKITTVPFLKSEAMHGSNMELRESEVGENQIGDARHA